MKTTQPPSLLRRCLAILPLAVASWPLSSPAAGSDPGAVDYSGRKGQTLYVSKQGDNSNGRSWVTAYHSIQTALSAVPDDRGGHRIIVRPDTYLEANLHPAHPGASQSYNALIGDHDGRLGSGAKGWVVIDAGDPAKGFKSWDWWSSMAASDKRWPTGNNQKTFSSIVCDRWVFRNLYATGGDAGLFWDLTDKSGEGFTVVVEDCVGIGRAFGGGVCYPTVRQNEPTVFRRSYFLALDWVGDTAAVLLGGWEKTMPEVPHAVFEDCTLVHPDNAVAISYASHCARARFVNCQMMVLNFTQPEMGGKSTGILCTEGHRPGAQLHVDLEDCVLAGYSLFTPGDAARAVSYSTQGKVQAYLQFKQSLPDTFQRLGRWPTELFSRIAPPPSPEPKPVGRTSQHLGEKSGPGLDPQSPRLPAEELPYLNRVPADLTVPAGFPYHLPDKKPDRPLSVAMERLYNDYLAPTPEANELYSTFKFTSLEGLDYHNGDGTLSRRDPSKVIRVNGNYYVWYTHRQTPTPPRGAAQGTDTIPSTDWDLAEIWYATSDDGFKWHEQGVAIPRPPKPDPGWRSVSTTDILVWKGKYYLYYQGFLEMSGKRGDDCPVTASVADSPDGPWRPCNKIIIPNGAPGDWDQFSIHDPYPLVYKGKIYLYYKSDFNNAQPHVRAHGLATADDPLGPFTKHPLNPIMNSGHETTLFPFLDGIAAFAIHNGLEHNTIQYAPDGVNFRIEAVSSLMPVAAGPYVPDAFTDTKDGRGITWGLCHITAVGAPDQRHSILARFDCDLSRDVNDPWMKQTDLYLKPEAYFSQGLNNRQREQRETAARQPERP